MYVAELQIAFLLQVQCDYPNREIFFAVISTAHEPTPGWIDNFYGPTGVAAGVATGVLRTMHADPKMNANVVPVDLTVNALIASAWDVAMQTAR